MSLLSVSLSRPIMFDLVCRLEMVERDLCLDQARMGRGTYVDKELEIVRVAIARLDESLYEDGHTAQRWPRHLRLLDRLERTTTP